MIKRIAVLGAGTMGHGIAETFAMNGYDVSLYEVFDPVREKVIGTIRSELEMLARYDVVDGGEIEKILGRITLYKELEPAVRDADYVIEATPENLELKQKLFRELDGYCKKEAVFGSNTSSLSLEKMTEGLSDERKARTMVCHWYNPAHLMPLVELSYFGNMEQAVYEEIEDLYKKAGKQTVKVLKDVPGLVANRIQQGVAEGSILADREWEWQTLTEIDKALKFGPAFRYATTGQFEVADLGGLDIWCVVGDNLLGVMDNRKEANPLLREKVAEGKLGFKSGEGFFSYPEDKKKDIMENFTRKLIIQLKTSKNYIE